MPQRRLIDHKWNVEKCTATLREFGFDHLDPNAPVSGLPLSIHFILDILHGVLSDVKVLVIGDILFQFSPNEFSPIMRLLRQVASLGVCVILFASNYTDFLKEIDRISVIRSNTIAYNSGKPIPDKDAIKTLMVGEPLKTGILAAASSGENIILELSDIHNGSSLKNISLNVHKGETIGLMDLSSNRSGEAVADILCTQAPCSGVIRAAGSVYRLDNNAFQNSRFVQLISSVDMGGHMFYNMNLMNNITVDMPDASYYAMGRIDKKIQRFMYKDALALIDCEYLIPLLDKYNTLSQVDKTIQMQILFARAICAKRNIIVLKGLFNHYDSIDISQFQRLLHHTHRLGISVIIVSSNFDKLRAICSRIYVFDEGNIVHELI